MCVCVCKQKTAYEMRMSDWSSDVCASDLVLSPDVCEGLGITLRSKKLIVVKSAHHFHAAFAPVASEVLYVDAPGTCQQNFAGIPFTKRSLHYWPRVADPWQDR